eukprot:TRINITY_DN9330_c0_g3_i1.p1 TRINITY_DN9330_c0_g3~~TRINITY_DN9330_c0_g3_i1.p1  ORF type:complete len:193 (-),score=43.57 TRINITY_DN9330_c0_g3_i1:955-1533(-)
MAAAVLVKGGVQMTSTLMIKNLPSRWSCEDVVNVFHDLGYEAKYDFFYMPKRDRSGKSQSLGYAFINFIDPVDAQRFSTAAEDGLVKFKSRVASVAPAQVQGLAELRKHFAGKSIMHFPAAPSFGGPVSASSRGPSPRKPRKEVPPESPGRLPKEDGTAQASVEMHPKKRWCDLVDDDGDDWPVFLEQLRFR